MIIKEKSPKIVRIGVVEDDRITRMLLVEMISRQAELALVGHWGSAEEFWNEGREVPADVLLVDLDLPQENGASLIHRIKQERPDLSCVVLTASCEPQDVFQCLRKGASGYLVKDTSPAELLDGIRAVAKDGASLSPLVARFLVEEFRNVSVVEVKKPGLKVLTMRELEILRNLAAGQAPKDVANELALSYETVRAHLKKIYQKLHVKSREDAVGRFVMEGGNDGKASLADHQVTALRPLEEGYHNILSGTERP
jgi:two-component system nitrate/nitrite response regulator NarL